MSCLPLEEDALQSFKDYDLQLAISSTMMRLLRSKQEAEREADLILQQNQLLKDIQQQIINKKSSGFLTESDQSQTSLQRSASILFRPNALTRRGADFLQGATTQRTRHSVGGHDSGKFRRRSAPTAEDMEDMVRQVHLKCSIETYETLQQILKSLREATQKNVNAQAISSQYQKQKKQVQQLRMEYSTLEKKLFETERKIRQMEESTVAKEVLERERKQQAKVLADKQKQTLKTQAALLVKQKLVSEDIKRLNTKIEIAKRQQKQMNQQRAQLDTLWERMLEKVDGGKQSPFQAQVYSKCKQSLLKQRKALAQQHLELERHHSVIEKLVGQMQGE